MIKSFEINVSWKRIKMKMRLLKFWIKYLKLNKEIIFIKEKDVKYVFESKHALLMNLLSTQ